MLMDTKIDISGALGLTDLILRKVPYATNNALTRTAKELVEVERAELVHSFHVRKDFVLLLVKITKYSRPDSLWTHVGIDRSKVRGGSVLLTEFETGGVKEPELGSEVAVPPTGGAVRPSSSMPQASSLLYKALKLKPHTTAGGHVQYKGDRRTFIIPGIGVFQRTSSRQRSARVKKGVAIRMGPLEHGHDEDVVLLYRFEPSVPLRAQMHFVQTARSYVNKRFATIWREEFVREMAGRAKK